MTRTDGRVSLCVAGNEATVRQALGTRQPLAWLPQPNDQFEFQLDVRDQAEIDHCVDALRAARVSVVSLAPVRETLEDAFLAVVRESKQSA